MTEIYERAPVPPQALEAEESVLGAIMIAPRVIDIVTEILTPGDFYRQSHGLIFQAALDLHLKDSPVDAITLTDQLEQKGELENVGGRGRIHELAALVPATANAAHYAGIVKEMAGLRAYIVGGQEIARLGWERPGPIPEIQERAEQIIFILGAEKTGDDVDFPQAVHKTLDEIQALEGNPRKLLGIPSGLADIDVATRGFRKGDLVVVAADTGRGKSALALNIALHLTVTHGLPVCFYSLEMSQTELVGRALSLMTRIPHDRLTRGSIRDADEWRRLIDSAAELASAPLTLRTDALIRPAGLRSHLRRWKAKHPTGALAVVDYLQLLTPDEQVDNRTVAVSAISRALKTTAMSLELPILAVSQLRRRLPNTKPHRNDLRESGSIENDASVVILIHHDDDRPGTAELIVAKNRHGAERTVDVQWAGELMRFSNLVHSVERQAA